MPIPYETSPLPSVKAVVESSSSCRLTALPGGTIAGIVIGYLLLIALMVWAWFFIRRRHRQHVEKIENSTRELKRTPSIQEESQPPFSIRSVNRASNAPYILPNPDDGSSDLKVPVLQAPAPWYQGDVTQFEYLASGPLHPSLRQSIIQPATPTLSYSPTATNGSPSNHSRSTTLENWASANRGSITKDMEEPLVRAGYLPDDSPDILTEEEWGEYGLTKIQLNRLRAIWAK